MSDVWTVPCAYCGVEIDLTIRKRKYCGTQCRRQANNEGTNRKLSERRKAITRAERACKKCHKLFKPDHGRCVNCPECLVGTSRMNAKTIGTCEICKVEFTRTGKGQTVCGHVCAKLRRQAYHAKRANRRKALVSDGKLAEYIICKAEGCSKRIYPLNEQDTRTYCSKKCRTKVNTLAMKALDTGFVDNPNARAEDAEAHNAWVMERRQRGF